MFDGTGSRFVLDASRRNVPVRTSGATASQWAVRCSCRRLAWPGHGGSSTLQRGYYGERGGRGMRRNPRQGRLPSPSPGQAAQGSCPDRRAPVQAQCSLKKETASCMLMAKSRSAHIAGLLMQQAGALQGKRHRCRAAQSALSPAPSSFPVPPPAHA